VKQTTKKEIEAVLRLDGPARFSHFIKRVVDSGAAWGLWQDGWALMVGDDGRQVFPIWPAKEYAELCKVDSWSAYEAKKIQLQDLVNDLLPILRNDDIIPGVFPTPGGKGVTLTVDELMSALKKEAGRYE
jgi:hypothetical protein